MKRRYAPRAWYNAERWQIDHESGEPKTLTVHEPEDGPVDTGLFDARGNRLFRRDEKDRIGFMWSDEE